MSAESWLDDYVRRLVQHGIVQESELSGCSASEIEGMEKEFGVSLPGLYRNWMLKFGRRAGNLVDVGEFDFYYPDIVSRNREARSIPPFANLLQKEPYFVVLGRLEIIQYVLDSPGKGDALVYQFDATDVAPPQVVYQSLTEVLEALLQDHLPLGGAST